MAYLRLYRVADWLHFLPLPILGAPDHSPLSLAAAIVSWALSLAYVSAINQAFDDRLDRAGKNPVGTRFARRRAVILSLPPLLASLAILAIFSPTGLPAGLTLAAAATLYSVPPRLKRLPLVGTLWNVVMAVPGFFFAGRPRAHELPLVGLFALLLLISQLIHEAQDRDDDAAGRVRTVATEAGRRAALFTAMLLVLIAPAAGIWFSERRLEITAACGVFALAWGAVLWTHLGCADLAILQRLRLYYRYSAILLGAVAFAATRV